MPFRLLRAKLPGLLPMTSTLLEISHLLVFAFLMPRVPLEEDKRGGTWAAFGDAAQPMFGGRSAILTSARRARPTDSRGRH